MLGFPDEWFHPGVANDLRSSVPLMTQLEPFMFSVVVTQVGPNGGPQH